MELLILIAFVSAGIGAFIANTKGRSVAEGLLLGFILGIFGLIIEAVLPSKNNQTS